VFSGFPRVSSTIVEIKRPAFPQLMIEIKAIAKGLTTQPSNGDRPLNPHHVERGRADMRMPSTP